MKATFQHYSHRLGGLFTGCNYKMKSNDAAMAGYGVYIWK